MSLVVDSSKQVERAAEEIGTCLELTLGNPDLGGGYTVLKRWYRHASVRAPKSSRKDMSKVMGDYAALYWKEDPTPPGKSVPTHVTPFRVNDNVPLEAEVEAAVR